MRGEATFQDDVPEYSSPSFPRRRESRASPRHDSEVSGCSAPPK
ncbi:hypothetical protein AZ78_4163 [Lysobacter capsici AZ78]|uniref:Uncharacterized protein n=1 Tax=Lysobacter capsici AZ78 TaxID=1444315 RepID=A0A120AHR7_9GAMM|nr:hypothetical protein AZ78_4163 [Lysobacter capsici AZ78]